MSLVKGKCMHSPPTEIRESILGSLSPVSFSAGHFPPTSQICGGFEARFRSHFGGSERFFLNLRFIQKLYSGQISIGVLSKFFQVSFGIPQQSQEKPERNPPECCLECLSIMASGHVDSLKNIKNKSFGASEVTPKDRLNLIPYL